MDYYVYKYEGPVEEFGKCVATRWSGTTRAVSERKARANLTYQYKKQFNRQANVKVVLPGKLTVVG